MVFYFTTFPYWYFHFPRTWTHFMWWTRFRKNTYCLSFLTFQSSVIDKSLIGTKRLKNYKKNTTSDSNINKRQTSFRSSINHWRNIFPQSIVLRNRHPRRCFPAHYLYYSYLGSAVTLPHMSINCPSYFSLSFSLCRVTLVYCTSWRSL